MKNWKIVFACVCLVGLTQLVWCQNDASGREHGIPGYLNPKTGMFTTRAQSEHSNAVPALSGTGTYYYGEFVISLLVFVGDAFPANTVYACSGAVTAYDGSGSYTETAAGTASAPSGGWTTCTLNMQYYWQLSTPADDYISVSFTAEADNVFTIGAASKIVSLRSASRDNEDLLFGVPTTNGTTTTFSFDTKL